jgi:osmotically-inducible protein OsmY
MVRQSLEWDVMVPDERITATVQHGVITLEGSVEVWAQREEAERTVRHLTGVEGVINQIKVAPPTVDASQVQHTIQDALARRATHQAKHVRVGVDGGTVRLSGRVQSWLEKRAILGAVSHAPGVEAIDDQLRIDPSS